MVEGPARPSDADLLLRAANGERTERTPVWLMRQAGRADPEYLATRDRWGLPLEKLFRNVDAAVEISLLPVRIGVDAVIFFQDILTPLEPMGAPFVFRPGPVLERPVRSAEGIRALRLYDPAEEIPFVGETLSILRDHLRHKLPLLGFAGAPLTLLCFLVEGGSPGQGRHVLRFLEEFPREAHLLLEKLAAMTERYLRYQIESGAQAVQLFESTADLFTEKLYREFALPYQQRVFESISSDSVPTILFAKGFSNLVLMNRSGARVLSISSACSIREARNRLGEDQPLQGNVNNRLLVEGTLEQIEQAVRDCISSGEQKGHILNLDHGLLRETPWDHVVHFVQTARKT